MGYILAIMQFLLIAYICVVEVKRKSSVVFMWATLIIMFGIMHTYSVFTGKNTYSGSVLTQVSLFVILFCLLYIITRSLTVQYVKETPEVFSYESLTNDVTERTGFLFMVFSLSVIFAVWKMISFSGGLLNTSWSSGRDYSASLGYANSVQITNILYFCLGGLPLYCWIRKQKWKTILSIALMSVITIVTRNRILVIPLLVLFIAYVLFKIKRIRLKHIVLAAFAAVAVIYLVYGLRVFRHYGSISVFLRNFELGEFLDKINLYIVTDNGELGLRNYFYYFIQQDNNLSGFGTCATYRRMLLVYIPTRFSFGLKPDDFAITMGAATGMAAGGSIHPTLFGDCYANLGWIGVLLGAFWGCYATLSDKIILKFKDNVYKILSYGLFGTMYVIMGRGSVYNSFFYIAWGIPILIILSYLQKHTNRIRFVFGNNSIYKRK